VHMHELSLNFLACLVRYQNASFNHPHAFLPDQSFSKDFRCNTKITFHMFWASPRKFEGMRCERSWSLSTSLSPIPSLLSVNTNHGESSNCPPHPSSSCEKPDDQWNSNLCRTSLILLSSSQSPFLAPSLTSNNKQKECALSVISSSSCPLNTQPCICAYLSSYASCVSSSCKGTDSTGLPLFSHSLYFYAPLD
jgi:hypothetical protein